jgi:hypothetical protein
MSEGRERKCALLEGLSHMPSNTCICGSCMLHMLTSVQSVDVDTSVMMWHPCHRPLSYQGPQCGDRSQENLHGSQCR